MRFCLIFLAAVAVACGESGAAGGLGGGAGAPEPGDTVSVGGSEQTTDGDGGKSSDGGTGGGTQSGGSSGGTTDSGGTGGTAGGTGGTGGTTTGGTGGTTTGGTGGGASEPMVCDPPDLSGVGSAAGFDGSGLCDWTLETRPEKYSVSGLDCEANDYAFDMTLATEQFGVELETVVHLLGVGFSCQFEDPFDAAHVRLRYEPGFCTKISTPFEFAFPTYASVYSGAGGEEDDMTFPVDSAEGCRVYSNPGSDLRILLDAQEDSWIRIDTVELGTGDSCSLTCP